MKIHSAGPLLGDLLAGSRNEPESILDQLNPQCFSLPPILTPSFSRRLGGPALANLCRTPQVLRHLGDSLSNILLQIHEIIVDRKRIRGELGQDLGENRPLHEHPLVELRKELRLALVRNRIFSNLELPTNLVIRNHARRTHANNPPLTTMMVRHVRPFTTNKEPF